jgi:(5-formylfuran-3-yl)methyl phosphate synthase
MTDPRPRRSGLLISVRSADEAAAALAGGADLIDVKEPARGPLGAANLDVIRSVVQRVAGRAPVSAALGEWAEPGAPDWRPVAELGVAYLKWGLAGFDQARFDELLDRKSLFPPTAEMVLVAYGDWQRAHSPSPQALADFAARGRFVAFLLDTWGKDGSTLLDWIPHSDVEALTRFLQSDDVSVALAGSLGLSEIEDLLPIRPSWFAVRGAVCSGGRREGAIDSHRVALIARCLQGESSADLLPATRES